MRPKFTNCCKLEQVSTREYGKMSQRIRVLEDGKVPAMESRNWKIEGLKRMITRTENQRLLNKFETEGFMRRKKDCGSSPEKMCCRIEESGLRKKVTLLESIRHA